MVSFRIFIVLFVILKSNQAHLSINSRQAEELSRLVQDIIQNERVPSILWAKMCWSKIDDFKYAKSIPFYIQIVKSAAPINLPIDENTNKQWFFIDMNCKSSDHFLSNVNDKYFAHPYRWIIADATNDSIQNLTFLPDSNIILVNKNIKSDEYILKQGNI